MKRHSSYDSLRFRVYRCAAVMLLALCWTSVVYSSSRGEKWAKKHFGTVAKVEDIIEHPSAYDWRKILKFNPDLLFQKDDSGDTLLLWAAGRGHYGVALWVLNNNAEVNVKNADGESALHLAAAGTTEPNLNLKRLKRQKRSLQGPAVPREQLVESLLNRGVDTNARDNDRRTPLHWAAYSDSKDVAGVLLATNADIDAKDNDGETPLHVAAAAGYKDMVDLLLDHKCDVNAKDNGGQTALHVAAGQGHQEVAESLLARGADVNATDFDGATPLHVTAEMEYRELAEVLREHGGQDPKPANAVAATSQTATKEGLSGAILRSGGVCNSEGSGNLRCAKSNRFSVIYYDLAPRLRMIDDKGPADYARRKASLEFNSGWSSKFQVDLAPGRHNLTVAFSIRVATPVFGGTRNTLYYANSTQNVSFVAAPGHSYELDSLVAGMTWTPIVRDVTDTAHPESIPVSY